MKNIKIYTDGACSGNPGPGGWAAILIYNQYRKEMKGFNPDTTNNQMELLAVLKGLEALSEPCAVDIYSDSRYVVDAIERGWITTWRKNGWVTSSGAPVKNREMWETLIKLAEYHTLKFIKVLGHSDDVDNNRCDELAKLAILEFVNKPKKGAKKKTDSAAPAPAPIPEKAPERPKAKTATASALKKKVK